MTFKQTPPEFPEFARGEVRATEIKINRRLGYRRLRIIGQTKQRQGVIGIEMHPNGARAFAQWILDNVEPIDSAATVSDNDGR